MTTPHTIGPHRLYLGDAKTLTPNTTPAGEYALANTGE